MILKKLFEKLVLRAKIMTGSCDVSLLPGAKDLIKFFVHYQSN